MSALTISNAQRVNGLHINPLYHYMHFHTYQAACQDQSRELACMEDYK